MRARRKLLLAALLILAVPAAGWTLFKPLRIIAPGLNGVTCSGAVCVEDPASLPDAMRLHAQAMSNVAGKLRPLKSAPRAVFCSTRACYHAFGGGMERGAAIFDLGVIISPESWQVYIVEHEFIHMLQAQELGLRGRERTPGWFKEGMPFHVSAPPAFDVPEYARPLMTEYAAWERQVGRDKVWEAIRRN